MRVAWRRGVRSALLATFAIAAVAGAQTEVVPAFLVGGPTVSPKVGQVDVAAGSDGSMVVLWHEYTPYGSDLSQHAVTRRFSAGGVALGPPIQIDSSAHVVEPSIAADPRGTYHASWRWIRSGREYAFFGVHLDAAAAPRGPDFEVTVPSEINANFGSVVGLPTGAAFVWEQLGLWARVVDADGNALGGDFLVSPVSSGIYRNHATATAAGGFVAAWLDFYSDPEDGTWARLLGAFGQPLGPAFLVATRSGYVRTAASPLGPVAVITSQGNADTGDYEIWAHHFTASGARIHEHLVHTAPDLGFLTFDADFDANGTLWVVWTENAGGTASVWGRAFDDGQPLGAAVRLTPDAASSAATARLASGRLVNAWRAGDGTVRAHVMTLCASPATCGDGVVQSGCEQCDAGGGNDDAAPDACRTDCRRAFCGDGVVDTGEQCDDGNVRGCDGCSSACMPEPGAQCGDGVRAAACGEECDDGPANGGGPGACRATCRLAACGDGVVDPGESCDDGNDHNCDGCDFRCALEPLPAAPLACDPRPLGGLTAEQRARFEDGRRAFLTTRTAATGLGPVFNGTSCADCHSQPTVGGASGRLVTRIGNLGAGGFDPLADYGGPLLQAQGIATETCAVAGEVVPPQATLVGQRQTPPLFGLGLLETLSDWAIVRNALRQERDRDGVSGRVSRLSGARVGRFGWKAQISSLHDFAVEAYVDEMGITTPFAPAEHPPQGVPASCDATDEPEDDGVNVKRFADFMRLLAPLPGDALSREARRGRRVFRRIRCRTCHTDRLRVDVVPPGATQSERLPVLSDLLLHDMGPELADGLAQGSAGGSEFRTPPLWAVRWTAPYLHDGRAATLEQAITLHGGEAAPARNRFVALSEEDRAALLAYLGAL